MNELPREYYDLEDSDNVCYFCQNPRYSILHKVSHYDFPFTFQQCECGLIKQTPLPNVRFFDWFFNSKVFFSAKKTNKDFIWGYHDYFADEPDRLATSQWRYKKLSPLFDANRLLEVMKIGPATGTFLYIAQQRGHHAIGCDVSTEFIQYAKEHYDVHIDHGRFEHQPYLDNQFDVILLFNVIENVPNQVEFFEAIQRTLKPGGYFVLNFVDMERNIIAALQKSRYFLFRPPICYMYTMSVMRNILEEFGFEIVDSFRDVRILNVEKIITLLSWQWALRLARTLGIADVSLPLYAYPSKILIARNQ